MTPSVPEKSTLFRDVPDNLLQLLLHSANYRIGHYDKGETIFHLMEPAVQIGLLLEGCVQAQKTFPNGSQINVSVKESGEMIGSAAAFSRDAIYPCDIIALEKVSVMLFYKEDLLSLLQKNVRILENFTSDLASSAYMLQQRLELLSYSGIAQKAAFWLLMQARKTKSDTVRIPSSVSQWAMALHVSRPSLHRELARIEQAGVIRYAPPFITILDADALQDVLSQ